MGGVLEQVGTGDVISVRGGEQANGGSAASLLSIPLKSDICLGVTGAVESKV